MISIAILDWLDEVRGEYARDPDTCSMIDDPTHIPKFEWRNDILWYEGMIYLIPTSRFKNNVLMESRDSLVAGHVGFFETHYNVR